MTPLVCALIQQPGLDVVVRRPGCEVGWQAFCQRLPRCSEQDAPQSHPHVRVGLAFGTRVRYFRNPCDRDPPTGNFRNFKFFKNSQKILNVYSWERTFSFGEITFTFGEITFTFGEIRFSRSFLGFWNFFLLLGGFWGSVGQGPRRGFSKISNH